MTLPGVGSTPKTPPSPPRHTSLAHLVLLPCDCSPLLILHALQRPPQILQRRGVMDSVNKLSPSYAEGQGPDLDLPSFLTGTSALLEMQGCEGSSRGGPGRHWSSWAASHTQPRLRGSPWWQMALLLKGVSGTASSPRGDQGHLHDHPGYGRGLADRAHCVPQLSSILAGLCRSCACAPWLPSVLWGQSGGSQSPGTFHQAQN